jgi:hypothetical protein
MRLFGDYDGSIARWNNGRVIPAPIQQYVDFLGPRLALTDGPIVDIGCGKAILTAVLGESVPDREIFGIDRQVMSVADGRYSFVGLDALSDAFPEFLTHWGIGVIVSRRSLCLFLSDQWLESLTGVKHLFSEALNDEDHKFTNAYAEAVFLRQHGWTVEIDGRFIYASRS